MHLLHKVLAVLGKLNSLKLWIVFPKSVTFNTGPSVHHQSRSHTE